MLKTKEKIGSDTQRNFETSPEIFAWAKKYNTEVAEINRIFIKNGNSISKTLDILRAKNISNN